jgi:hypothetical protein
VSFALDPRADAAYELVARSAGSQGPYRLRRVQLASPSVVANQAASSPAGTGPVVSGPVVSSPGSSSPGSTGRAVSSRAVSGRTFPVLGLQLAAGYVWVSGAVSASRSVVRLLLYQVSPVTLRVVRSWRFTRKVTAGIGAVPVASGPGGTVWVGFDRALWRVNPRTGVVMRRAELRSGLSVTDVAVDPARRYLYVSAEPSIGGAVVGEYAARSGRLLATTDRAPLRFSVAGAALTAVPGGVWASYRTGMAGQAILLRRRGLGAVRLRGGRRLFSWFMTGGTAYGGGSLWAGASIGDIGCVAPRTGRIRSGARLKLMTDGGEMLAVSLARHEVYAVGQSDILAITAPATCWQ